MSLTGTTANFGISSVNGIKMAADESMQPVASTAKSRTAGSGHTDLTLPRLQRRYQVCNAIRCMPSGEGELTFDRCCPIAQMRKSDATPSSTNPETRRRAISSSQLLHRPIPGRGYRAVRCAHSAPSAAIMVDRKNDHSTGLKRSSRPIHKDGGQMVGVQCIRRHQDFNAPPISRAKSEVILCPATTTTSA